MKWRVLVERKQTALVEVEAPDAQSARGIVERLAHNNTAWESKHETQVHAEVVKQLDGRLLFARWVSKDIIFFRAAAGYRWSAPDILAVKARLAQIGLITKDHWASVPSAFGVIDRRNGGYSFHVTGRVGKESDELTEEQLAVLCDGFTFAAKGIGDE